MLMLAFMFMLDSFSLDVSAVMLSLMLMSLVKTRHYCSQMINLSFTNLQL